MERSTILEAKVGIFVVLTVLLTIVFIMALGGDRVIFKHYAALHITADESRGLAPGSQVTVSGIPCGHVVDVRMVPEGSGVDILLKLDSSFMKRVTEGSTASIVTQGALGDKYVAIKPGPFNAKQIPEGGVVPLEGTTDLITTLGRSGNQIQKVFHILDNVDQLVTTLNERGFSENLSGAAQHFRSSSNSLDELLMSVRGTDVRRNKLHLAIDHLESILEKVDNGEGTLGALVNDPTIHDDLKALLGGAKRNKLLKYLIRSTIEKNHDDEGQHPTNH